MMSRILRLRDVLAVYDQSMRSVAYYIAMIILASVGIWFPGLAQAQSAERIQGEMRCTVLSNALVSVSGGEVYLDDQVTGEFLDREETLFAPHSDEFEVGDELEFTYALRRHPLPQYDFLFTLRLHDQRRDDVVWNHASNLRQNFEVSSRSDDIFVSFQFRSASWRLTSLDFSFLAEFSNSFFIRNYADGYWHGIGVRYFQHFPAVTRQVFALNCSHLNNRIVEIVDVLGGGAEFQ